MDLQLVLSFLGASVLLALLPGPDNILVLTESITKGKRNGVMLAAGFNSGILVHTIIAATGLSLILQTSEYAFQIIKYLGAMYMFYLAFLSIREKQKEPGLDKNKSEKSGAWKLFRKGFIMNVLNPKVSLFFIAFLPQFVNKIGFNVSLQMLILGFIFMVIGFIVFSLIALLSGNLSKYLDNPKFWNITKWGKATVLSVLGLFLVFMEM
ncbi:MAG: LysE family translocator [Bacteroidetes bacterium]|nr:MAG: LysE family translocator [Bacteroidota bacterium]